MTFAEFPNQAILQIAGTRAGDRQQISCRFDGVEGKRLRLTARNRIAALTPVTVEYSDAMFLGEVIACTEDLQNNWHIEIGIEQILTGLESLMKLRANLIGEQAPAALSLVAASAKVR